VCVCVGIAVRVLKIVIIITVPTIITIIIIPVIIYLINILIQVIVIKDRGTIKCIQIMEGRKARGKRKRQRISNDTSDVCRRRLCQRASIFEIGCV